jgi:hypothetical protein
VEDILEHDGPECAAVVNIMKTEKPLKTRRDARHSKTGHKWTLEPKGRRHH